MATNSLYLQDFPLPNTEKKIVKLTPVTSNGTPSSSGNLSPQQVAAALAAMTEDLLKSMEQMIQFLSKEAQQNADENQLNVAATSSQASQALAAQKAADTPPSVWSILLKYVLGPVLAVLALVATIWFCGPAAFVIAAAILVVTMIPVHNGQGMIASAVDAAVGAIAKEAGWSPTTTAIVEGVVNLVIGIAIGIATAGAASAATVADVAEVAAEAAETTAETVGSTVDTIASTTDGALTDAESVTEDVAEDADSLAQKAAAFKDKVGMMTGINSGAAVITSSNCFNDIIYGILAKSGVSDDKAKEIAEIVGMIANLAVMIGSLGYGISSMGSLAQGASEIKPASLATVAGKIFGEESAVAKLFSEDSAIGNALSKLSPTSVQGGLRAAELGTGAATAAVTAINGWEQHVATELSADITKLKGELAFFQGNSNITSQMTQMVNGALSDALKKFDALEKQSNYSVAMFSEAKEMLQANLQA